MIDDRTGFAEMVMLILGMRLTKMIEVAAALGLADLIDEEPRQIADLSESTGSDPVALRRLCRALVACGGSSAATTREGSHTTDALAGCGVMPARPCITSA